MQNPALERRALVVLAATTLLACGTPSQPGDDAGSNPDGRSVSDASDGATGSDARVNTDARTDASDSGVARDGGSTDGGIPTGVDPFACETVVAEIDPATTTPEQQVPSDASSVQTVLGRQARVMAPQDTARAMAFRIGAGAGLVAGRPYLLDVEYPDDVPRAIFVGNRGGDLLRGFATGTATGDSRSAYVTPSLESYAYPQTGQWRHWTQLFFLNARFQGFRQSRDPAPRTETPDGGFLVVLFQTGHSDDPRSNGVAVGRIRVCAVPDVNALHAPIPQIPAGLPKRRVFWREEMADGNISGDTEDKRALPDANEWFLDKLHYARALGFNTYAKDLLEFGFNQGWDSGDQGWMFNAQPPITDFWAQLVPHITADFGLDVMPYYEYKAGLGGAQNPASLGYQHRATKLYDGMLQTCGSASQYTCTWWTESADADVTDPDTLADAEHVFDRTIGRFQGQATFAGAWFRTRQTHLPIGFGDATIARFRAAFPGDSRANGATRADLIASFEGDKVLYEQYVQWWLRQRAAFLTALRDYGRQHGGASDFQMLFTPWIQEQVPEMRNDAGQNLFGIVTDDPAWWNSYASSLTDDWYRWAWNVGTVDQIVAGDLYGHGLAWRDAINPSDTDELWHSAPGADPENYRDLDGAAMTFPSGRLFTVARPELLDAYRTRGGLTVVHHYTLNEDDGAMGPTSLPFDGVVGYASVAVERAGAHATLLEARAVANGDPRNLGYLEPASISSGFPREVRRFHQAFTAVPALPSTRLASASNDAAIVVREIPTPSNGTYYFVVNTAMDTRSAHVAFPAAGTVTELVPGTVLPSGSLDLTLESGELRAYRVQ